MYLRHLTINTVFIAHPGIEPEWVNINCGITITILNVDDRFIHYCITHYVDNAFIKTPWSSSQCVNTSVSSVLELRPYTANYNAYLHYFRNKYLHRLLFDIYIYTLQNVFLFREIIFP
jgi:hypothetical protein